MRFVTFSEGETTRIGAMLGQVDVVDLSRVDSSIPPDMISLLRLDKGIDKARTALAAAEQRIRIDRRHASSDGIVHQLAAVTIEAPIARPGKVLAIGLNYRDHAEETGAQIPKYPIVFSKVSTCITGPNKPVQLPRISSSLDWEAEMCFVIGRGGRHIPAESALEHVAGYTIGNDLSVRDWQFHSPTWMMGKGFDTHGPIGPWIVTPDEVDPTTLAVKTFVNGELKQSSNTRQLIFDVPAIIAYISDAFTLEPGDIVFTGTPAGVGFARKPPEFLKAGDVVRIEIDGLGALENHVIEEQ